MNRTLVLFSLRPLQGSRCVSTRTAMPPLKGARLPESTKVDAPYHFYQNKVLEPYLKQSIHANNLRQFILFGRQMTPERLIQSANWVRNELLVRLAHRIRDFQQLPFIIGTNPNIEWPYRLYWGGFEALRKTPEIKTKDDNLKFCAFLEDLLEDGQQTLPRMALGISECAHHFHQLPPHDHTLDRFLNRMLRSRISRRLIAEQHVTLTRSLYGSPKDKAMVDAITHKYSKQRDATKQVGIFNADCSARAIFDHAKALITRQDLPPIELAIHNHDKMDDNDIAFAYIPEQLEHILYELLNNAIYHTTIRHHQHHEAMPPIKVTISCSATDIYFRISDQGGGISPGKYERLWSYQARAHDGDFDDVDVQHLPKMPVTMAQRIKQQEPVAATKEPTALGIGLILSRIYAEYWGGELQIISMDGFGTDAYVRIPRLGLSPENIDVSTATTTVDQTQPQSQQIQHHTPHAASREPRRAHHVSATRSQPRVVPTTQKLRVAAMPATSTSSSPASSQPQHPMTPNDSNTRHVLQRHAQYPQNSEGWAASTIIMS
ncbi:hypothetical protein BC940DRAFT_300626 [Gongronella butleri]|nr:hypothetical protein BC940DRAFT_300626 [Gongronella butleri]